MTPHDAAREAALARVATLEARGDLVAALDALVEAAASWRSPSIERQLLRLRHAAFPRLERAPVAWPPAAFSALEPAPPGGFEVPAEAFTSATLATGLLRHGHVLVRGLVPPERVACLRDAVERSFEARDAAAGPGLTAAMRPWYDPVDWLPGLDAHRLMVRAAAGVLAADSPRAFFELLATMRSLGVDRMVAEYFGERPALSLKKCTLRRVRLRDGWDFLRICLANWHQDGAFLGRDVRTVNAWLALSRCGRSAPGMQLLPARLDHLLATGARGASYDWTISNRTVARAFPHVSIWEPEFQPGDALFFDHWFLHRTAARGWQWRARYAIETWFFAPSVYADDPATALVV